MMRTICVPEFVFFENFMVPNRSFSLNFHYCQLIIRIIINVAYIDTEVDAMSNSLPKTFVLNKAQASLYVSVSPYSDSMFTN